MTSSHWMCSLFVHIFAFEATGSRWRRHDGLIKSCPAALHCWSCQHAGLLHDGLIWGSHQFRLYSYQNNKIHAATSTWVARPQTPACLTDNISVLTHDFLSWHLWILQLFEELIQTVCFNTLSPLPQFIWHQWRQTACEHLKMDTQKSKTLNILNWNSWIGILAFLEQLILSVKLIYNMYKLETFSSLAFQRGWAGRENSFSTPPVSFHIMSFLVGGARSRVVTMSE